jgi:hypothetical protein
MAGPRVMQKVGMSIVKATVLVAFTTAEGPKEGIIQI